MNGKSKDSPTLYPTGRGYFERRVGCVHNLARQVIHAPRGINSRGESVYVVGDTMTLRCPRGCPDIVIEITSQPYKRT